MTAIEWGLAALFGLLGLRSIVYWLRRRLAARSLREHVLYALWLTGRAGMWFAIAGIFVISASIETSGGPYVDEFYDYRWYIFVPITLAAMQLVAGLSLGRARPD